jgi:hypothetical protein
MLVFLLAACSEEKVKEVSKEVEAKSESKEETNDKEVVATPFNPVELLGNYILDEQYYSTLSKRDDKTLVLENDMDDIGTLVFEITAVGDKEVDVIILDAGHNQHLLGSKFKLKLSDDEKVMSLVPVDLVETMGVVEYRRTYFSREEFPAEKDKFFSFVDVAFDFTDDGVENPWTASTGEKEVEFMPSTYYETGTEGTIYSHEIGKIEGDTEDFEVSVVEYTESSIKGKVYKTPESKSDWLGQEVTIEKIDDNNILILIGEEEITLNNGQ